MILVIKLYLGKRKGTTPHKGPKQQPRSIFNINLFNYIETNNAVKKEKKPATKQSIEEILKEIDMTSSEMNEKEAAKLQELDKILTENPDLKNMTVEDLIGMLNLSEEDKNKLNEQVQEILHSTDLNSQSDLLNKQFPGIDPAMDEMMRNIQMEFAKTPGLQEEFTTWINGVQAQLGNDLEKINTMSEEEVNKISLPPPRLRAVLDKYIPDTDKYNTLNLDKGMAFEFGTKEDLKEDEEEGEPIEIEEIKMH